MADIYINCLPPDHSETLTFDPPVQMFELNVQIFGMSPVYYLIRLRWVLCLQKTIATISRNKALA